MNETPPSKNASSNRWRLLTLLAVICLLVGALVLVLQVFFRSSGLFKTAIAELQANQSVIDALGEPLEPGMVVTGNLSLGSPLSSGTLHFSVVGPMGSGQVSVAGVKGMADWELLYLTLIVEGSDEPIKLQVEED